LIPLSNPDITDLEKQAVLEVLNTPNLSIGPKIPEFEKVIADFTGVKYAVAMSSGTAVLHTIIRSLELKEGDLFLTTPFSFISTSNCLLFEGAKPIFVDIDLETYNITPEKTEEKYLSLPDEIRKIIKGIIYIDAFGNPADGEGFERLGKKYNLFILEDSAEALGSSFKNKKCGSFGDAGLFAFYPNKQITTGEGGMLVTNNEQLAISARSLRNQGRDEGAGWLQHSRLGYNYRLSDINASLGIAQMKRIDELISKRRNVKEIYDNFFEELFDEGLLIPQKSLHDAFVTPFVYVLRLSDKYDFKSREEVLTKLRNKDIQCSNYFTPIHLQSHYKELGWKKGDMPITEKVSERTIALPFYNNLKEDSIEYIFKTLKSILKG
jgi:perosamine synthetase